MNLLLENLDKCINTIINEIESSHKEAGIDISQAPDALALLNITRYVQDKVMSEIGGQKSYVL